jgi:HNH endonuclease
MRIYTEKDIERFWMKVDVRGPDDCWDWLACTFAKGYGKFSLGRDRIPASIAAYEITNGPANGLFVCHSCDRPVCCNPRHLWLGTNLDNQRDAASKGRGPTPPRGNFRAILTEQDVLWIVQNMLPNMTNVAIGQMYGVSHSTISALRRGKTWSNITGLGA